MKIIINPGAGDVDGTTEENGIANMVQFLIDMGIEGVSIERLPNLDERGRYGFGLNLGERKTCVEMVGLPLEKVRYQTGMNAWDFPRLYVDGSSWLWEFAVSAARDDLTEDKEEY